MPTLNMGGALQCKKGESEPSLLPPNHRCKATPQDCSLSFPAMMKGPENNEPKVNNESKVKLCLSCQGLLLCVVMLNTSPGKSECTQTPAMLQKLAPLTDE